ncbi:MAG: TFIIH complex serine/threonine-protein kinase subunit kin28 [Pycnora praestabilis]|nr:MAG: TFIIH complex serine/threonine-protein kinase subunit kin28 [Pycnora praestabilis]
MAVSPAFPAQAPASTKVPATRAKVLTVPDTVNGIGKEETMSGQGSGQELAEQLNEETKRRYTKDKKLGEGTYAVVYLGHLRADPKSLVAIKKIKVNTEYRDGISMDAIREIKFLQELSHPNIIALHSVFSSKNQNLNLVLEYLPRGDLEMLIKDSEGVTYGTADIKAWMGMLGRAVWFCHKNFVLHRDIKPNNLLIAADGEIKLADFGLARSFSDPYRAMSHQVITRWYRPPELLFGARYYSGAVDIWSMALVFAELLIRNPYLPGNTDMHQLDLICQAVGTPTEENWPGVSKLPDYVQFQKESFQLVRGWDHYMMTFGTAGAEGVGLLMSMMSLDPRKRPTAHQILEDKWWAVTPSPTKKHDLPKKGGGEEKMAEDLKRRGGELEETRGEKVARKLDFSARN